MRARDAAAANRVSCMKARAAVGAVLLALALVVPNVDAQTTTKRSYDAGSREIGRGKVRPDGSSRYRDEHGYEVGRSERRLDGITRYFGRLGPPVRYGALGD